MVELIFRDREIFLRDAEAGTAWFLDQSPHDSVLVEGQREVQSLSEVAALGAGKIKLCLHLTVERFKHDRVAV